MSIKLQKYLLKIYAKLIAFIGILTINSACFFGFHQPKEAESLKRFKKYSAKHYS